MSVRFFVCQIPPFDLVGISENDAAYRRLLTLPIDV